MEERASNVDQRLYATSTPKLQSKKWRAKSGRRKCAMTQTTRSRPLSTGSASSPATSEQKSNDRISISFKCRASKTSNLTAASAGGRHYFDRFRLAASWRRQQAPAVDGARRRNVLPSRSHYDRRYYVSESSFTLTLLASFLLAAMTRPAAAASHKMEMKQFVHSSGLLPFGGSSRPPARTGLTNPDAPKLIPLSALDRYQEGADLRLFCSASAAPGSGRLHFEWRKNSNELLVGGGETGASKQLVNGQRRIQISSMEDEGASLLRISQLDADDTANYTCLVRNQHGFDSSTVRVQVNVGLKWTLEPPGELQVRAGKPVQLECDASGQPAPLISWTSIKDHRTIDTKVLRFDRANSNHSGLYECRATSQSSGSEHGEQLRKIVRLTVNDAQDDKETGWTNRRRQRLERNQIVQDDQGRRRFHGAFTGGFSAGYHNTVDSVKGFQPKSFTSRRGLRAQDDGPSFQHRPEDYMDEEDFSEFGIAPKKVRVAGQFSEPSGSAESRPKLDIPLVVNDSIGDKILRHMTRNRTASCQKQHDIQDFTPKNDYHGLGYKPIMPRPSTVCARSSQSALEASFKSGNRLKISGEAFGVGVFDECEDDSHALNEYGHDDLTNYDFGHKKANDFKEFTSAKCSLTQPHLEDRNLLPGFELAKDLGAMELCDKECLKYPLPIIEEGWKMPVRTEPIVKPSEESDLNRKNIDLYTSRVVSFSGKFARSESGQAKRASDIESRSGLVLYSDLKTLAEPIIHEPRPVRADTRASISISRRVVDWRPCSLLCKHFGVDNPYPDNKFCGVKPSDLNKQPAEKSDEHLHSTQADYGQELAPIEQRKSIFNVYFRDSDDTSDSDHYLEDEPQVVELDSDDKSSGHEVDVHMLGVRAVEKSHDLDTDPEVVVMDVQKKEPEVIVLSSSDSSDNDEGAYGPPLPPSRQTLTDLHGHGAKIRGSHSSSMKTNKSHKHKSHRKKKKKKHKKDD